VIDRVMASLLLAAEKNPMAIQQDAGARTPFEAFASDALFLIVDVGVCAIALGMGLCLWRLLRGPSLVDRGVAADTFTFQVVALVVLLTIRLSTLVDFDAVLIVSILGFVSTVAVAQFIGRRGVAT